MRRAGLRVQYMFRGLGGIRAFQTILALHNQADSDTLGISLSTIQRQESGQRIEYTGVIVDTVADRLFIPETKLEKRRKCLTSLIASPDCFTLEILSVREGSVNTLCVSFTSGLWSPRLALKMRT